MNGYEVGERVRLFHPHYRAGRVGEITGFSQKNALSPVLVTIRLDSSDDDVMEKKADGLRVYGGPAEVSATFEEIRHERRRRIKN